MSGFDFACVTVIAENLIFQISRCRGEVDVKVGPAIVPSDLHGLLPLLRTLGPKSNTPGLYAFNNMQEIAPVLESRFQDLIQTFSLAQ
jgi:hypothetical protein